MAFDSECDNKAHGGAAGAEEENPEESEYESDLLMLNASAAMRRDKC